MYKKDFFLLDIPFDYKDEEAVTYLEIQLKEMTKRIEKQLNKKIDNDRLAEVIRLSNKARYYFVKINELRTNIPAPIPGGEAIDYAAILAFTWGSKEIVEVYKLLYEEIKSRVENSGEPGQKRKIRILWRHLRPYYNNYLFDFIENECDAEVAFEEVNHIYWEEMDPKEPYRSLAKKLLANPPVGDFQRWIDATLGLIDKYNIDGIVSFNHWGCRQLCSGEGILKDILNKKDIPMIQIGGDCIDKRDYSFAQLKTRIQAFLEMVKVKKE
jgi:benzoyl-CoA reductase/2-hydroxyglutaryl-CoA dehydratase subunit BcrC/BadD/HgdB